MTPTIADPIVYPLDISNTKNSKMKHVIPENASEYMTYSAGCQCKTTRNGVAAAKPQPKLRIVLATNIKILFPNEAVSTTYQAPK